MRAQTNSPLEDYFSTTLESLWKDVECMFGILKGRWTSLDKGYKYRKMKTCGEIFLACAVLHKMILSEMVREGRPPLLQRGVHLVSDGMWLEGPSQMVPVPGTDNLKKLKEAFDLRWTQLCHHLRIWKDY